MDGRYSFEQLLKLRDSPLVAKPTNLPPIEEWMGPPAEPTQKRTTSGGARTEPPSRFNSKMGNGGIILSSNAKTPFSATFKPGNTPFESPRSAFGNFGAGTPRDDYFSKGRYTRSGEEGAEESSTRPRRGESWSTGQDGEERSNRRGVGRESDGDLRDGRDSRRQRGNDENRRNGTGRTERNPWLRDEEHSESRPRDGARSGGWRDAGPRRGQGREWKNDDRDAEPEWMESDDRSNAQPRTVQDIEAWKASMRARDQGTAQPESAPSSNQHSRTTSQAASTKPKAETPLMLDPSVDDKFFGILGQPRAASSGTKGEAVANPPKPAKASKFSGFFGPQTPVAAAEAVAPPPPPAAQPPPGIVPVDDDKAGFQRILAMLAGPQGGIVLPGQPAPGLPASHSAPPRRSTPPPADNATLQPTHSPPPIISPRSRRPGALENLLGMQSPREGAAEANVSNQPTNKDADFLLNLLKSRDGAGPHGAQQGPMGGGMPPGFYGGPQGPGQDHQDRPGSGAGAGGAGSRGGGRGDGPGGGNNRGMFDDFHSGPGGPHHGEGPGGHEGHHHGPPHHGPPHPEHQHPQHHHHQHPPHDRPHPSYDEDPHDRGFPPFPMSMGPPPPPGLQRPPGFEHMGPPMPGFPPFMNPGARPPGGGGGGGGDMLRAPPGLGGRPPGGFPPGLIPQMGNMGLNERSDERGGGGPPGPGPPPFGPGPGRGPPPGFGGPNGMPPPPHGHPPPGPPRGFPHPGPGMEGFPPGMPIGHGAPPGRMMDLFDGHGGRGGPPPPPPGPGAGPGLGPNAGPPPGPDQRQGPGGPPPGFERR